jgi:hypothetical protein
MTLVLSIDRCTFVSVDVGKSKGKEWGHFSNTQFIRKLRHTQEIRGPVVKTLDWQVLRSEFGDQQEESSFIISFNKNFVV